MPQQTAPMHAPAPVQRPPQEPDAHAPPEPRPVPKPHVFSQKAIDDVFDKTVKFADLGLSPEALRGVTEAGFVMPTAIQARIIPLLLAGKDILGQAKTGTGKTAAFGLPLLSKLRKGDAMSAIILVPTRELAIQVATDLNELGRYTGITSLPVYGGQNISTQAQRLARGPEIIVATPGRLMDMHQRGYLHYHNIKVAILDEVDRMLDIGFRDDIRRILGACPKDRQTVFVSATLPPEVETLARTFARDAEKIVATSGSLTATMVKQYHLPVEPWDKKQLLLHLLTHEAPALTLVFCRTKKTVDNLTEYLMRKGIDAHAMHGDMYQAKRNKVLEKLKSGSLSVLIASDLASRGLDVEGITHVINYDLPEDPDLYVHRIGRTARAGRDGVAWALVTPEQGGLLTEIEMLINAEIPKLDYPDFKPGPLPPDIAAERERGVKRSESKPLNRFAVMPVVPVTSSVASVSAGGAVRPAAPIAVDPSKFPGGIVPSKLPDRRLGGRVRSARSMRQQPAAPIVPVAEQPAPASSSDPASQPAAD
jgi:ATP-dependent RNA helicase DeaD